MKTKKEMEIIGMYKTQNATDADSIFSARKQIFTAKVSGRRATGASLLIATITIALISTQMPLDSNFHIYSIAIIGSSVSILPFRSASKWSKIIKSATRIYCEEIGVNPEEIL